MVTLISNGSMANYPHNTGNNFTNRLGEPIDLRGAVMNEDMSWEVAMADFQYTNVFDQINKAIDCRIVLLYPSAEDEAEITREAADEAATEQAQEQAAEATNRESLETNEIGDTTHGGVLRESTQTQSDEALNTLHEAGLVTPVGGEQQSQRPAKKRKKQAAAASDTPAAATGTSTTDKPVYDKVLYQAAREAWQKASSSKGVGALMFDHQFSTVGRRSDVIDEGITNYVHRNFHYLVGEHRDSVGGMSSAEWRQAEVATVQVKIGRGDYDSPMAIAYMMAATYNMVIKQLVNRPSLNTHLRVEIDADGKIEFVCDDMRLRHMIIMDDKRLADILGLHTTHLMDEHELPLYRAELRGTARPLLATYVPNMFVYCDIVSDQYVGDVMAPLLDLVPVKRGAMGDRVQYSLIPPSYLEVARKFIDTIHVEIRDDKGVLVPFDDSKGTVVVRLHFRRKGVMPSFVM